MDVPLFTWKLSAALLPNRTLVAPVKSQPLIVTGVPPAVAPRSGLTDVTASEVPGRTSKEAEAEIVPGSTVVFGSVTVTVFIPTTPEGTVNVPLNFGAMNGPGTILPDWVVMLYCAALMPAVVDPG
jgi:hypothetical protein